MTLVTDECSRHVLPTTT